MDTNSDSDNVAVESGADTALPLSVGKILREARISQGLSVADVAASIKFAPRQVEALEADDFSHLPELAFVRGFVRSYARLLHIDELPLLDSLPRAHQQLTSFQEELAGVPFSASQANRRINMSWLYAALALAAVLLGGVWLSQDKPEVIKTEEAPVSVVAPIEQPAVPDVMAASAVHETNPAAPILPLVVSSVPVATAQTHEIVASTKWAKQGPIHLIFETAAWADITDTTGKTLLRQVNEPNTERWLKGEPPFSLVIR